MSLARIYWFILVFSEKLCCPADVRRTAVDVLEPFRYSRVLMGRNPRCIAAGSLWYSYVLMDEKHPGTLLDWCKAVGVSENSIGNASRLVAESWREECGRR